MGETIDTDDRPSHGPYGELWWDDAPDARRWRTRLTDEGKAFVADQIERQWGGAVIKLLWTKYKSFARYVLTLEPEDHIEQHCRVGFLLAAIRFDPSQAEFATFAAPYLRSTCQTCVEDPRTWKAIRVMSERRKRGWSGAKLVRGFLDNKEKFHTLDEANATPEPSDFESDKLVIQHKVDEWLDRVPKRHAHVVREYIIGERTLESIGNELGITKERVRQLVNSTKQRLGYIITPSEYEKVVGV